MVAITQTVNLEFGSGVMVDGYGFVLNVALNKPLINPVNSSQYPLIIYNDIL